MTRPFDSEALFRDDALLDALARGEFPDGYEADPTAQLLLAWRSDLDVSVLDDATVTLAVVGTPAAVDPAAVDPAPVNGSVVSFEPAAGTADDVPGDVPDDGPGDGDLAVTALADRRRSLGARRRLATMVAVAAGVVAASAGGGVAAAATAEPGDALWPITKVVYAERAESLEARDEVRSTLREARLAASRNDTARAAALLRDAMADTEKVRPRDGRDELKAQAALVQQEIAEDPLTPVSPDPAPTVPPADPTTSPAPDPSPVEPPPTPADPPPSPDASSEPPGAEASQEPAPIG